MNYIRHLGGFFIKLAGDSRMTPYHISLYFALFQQWNAGRFREQILVSRGEMMELSRIGSVNTYARCMKELAEWGYIRYTASSNIHQGSRVSCIRLDTSPDVSAEITDDAGIKSNTGTGTIRDTAGITGSKTDTGSDTAGNTATGINAGRKTDTAGSAASGESDPAGIKSDTGTDPASDTLLINITNMNKLKENKERIKKEKKENPKEKEKRREGGREENSETDPEEETAIPDFLEVSSFFEQNHFPRSEAQKFYTRYQSTGWKTGDNQKILSWQALARKWMINSKKINGHERPFNPIGAGRFSVPTCKDYSEPL
ncbi:MAG: hypothetical protein AB2L24_09495 [Mangrovibacterium sp.]